MPFVSMRESDPEPCNDWIRPQGQKMDFLTVMHTYFRGEKMEAALFIAPAGLLLIALAVGAWRSETAGFMWGAVIPATIFGLMLTGTGIGIAGRTAGQVAALEAGFTADVVTMH